MIVYHYTDIDNLQNIISFEQGEARLLLRGLERSFLKDDPQSIFGQYIFPACIKEIEADLTIAAKDSLLPMIGNENYRLQYLPSLKQFNDRLVQLHSFVFSFSELQDNLDLWTRYGNKGIGISIGLDTDKLQPEYSHLFNHTSGNCTYWTESLLDSNFKVDKESAIYKDVKEAYTQMTDARVIETFKKIYSNNTSSDILSLRMGETLMTNLINRFSIYHKSHQWESEKEYRVSLSGMTGIRYIKNKIGDYIPYIEVKFPIEALRIIVIGPKCGRNSYGMIQSLLQDRGVKHQVQILDSICPIE